MEGTGKDMGRERVKKQHETEGENTREGRRELHSGDRASNTMELSRIEPGWIGSIRSAPQQHTASSTAPTHGQAHLIGCGIPFHNMALGHRQLALHHALAPLHLRFRHSSQAHLSPPAALCCTAAG